MKPRYQFAALAIAGLVGTFLLPTAAEAEPAPSGLSDTAISQIEALTEAKLARTADELKVDSPLLAATELAKGSISAAVPNVMSTIETDGSGRTTIEVQGQVDDALLKRVDELGGAVLAADGKEGVARIDLAVDAVTALAAEPQVTRIRSVAAGAITSAAVGSTAQQPTAARSPDLTDNLTAALDASPRPMFAALTGAVTSQGDVAHGADTARAQFGVTGVGVTVGVLSDGVDALGASVSSGELPGDVRVLPGQAGSGNEGTAMLQIVHDVAPNAKLLFATAFNGAASFADNIRALRAAGADIIVDDVLYFAESPFQDGPIAQAVIEVTRDGALYFSSAGNEGNVDDGTAGNYEGDYVPSGVTIGKYAGEAHDFAPGPAVQVVDPVTAGSGGVRVLLQWADPLGQAADDYDLYALDAQGNVVGYSNNVQNGDDDPYEIFVLPTTGKPLRLAVVKFAGEGRYFQLTALRGRFAADGAIQSFATPGATRGHSAVPAAFSVAAAPAAAPFGRALEPGDPPNPAGPFPHVFSAAQLSERFTSDGPRRVFFTPDGTPLTPGNFSATGGQVRQKPDLTAADGVSTTAPGGYNPFFGTSASAPHAAAIAALVLSGRPNLATSTTRAALEAAALDIEAAGPDRDTGQGVLIAGDALAAVGARAQAYPAAGRPIVVDSTDGDGFLEPGETGTVEIPVTNNGDATALLVNVSLDSSTPGVTIAPQINNYGNVPVGQTVTRSFSIAVPSSIRLGSKVALTSTVRFAGEYSPRTADGQLVVGQPSSETVRAAYTGPPVAIPENNTTGVSVPLTVSGVGPVSGVSFSIDGTECNTNVDSTTVGLSHTYVHDLIGTLTAPDGTAVRLFERTGGSGNNLCQVRLVDNAPTSIQSAAAANAPYTGDWRPAQPLADFQGAAADGTWLFTVADVAGGDIGAIRAFSVTVQGYATDPPAPVG